MINIENRFAAEIAKAKKPSLTELGLRFDRSVMRLIDDLRAHAEQRVPNGITVLLTVTAPIRLRAKTAGSLKEKLEDLLESEFPRRDRRFVIHRNHVRIRLIKRSSKQLPKLVGLVHNPDIDPRLLLNLVEEWLLKAESTKVTARIR
jgi:hypothetical protein